MAPDTMSSDFDVGQDAWADFDRPTAIRNTLGAVTNDNPLDELHPGPDLLRHHNTARNRINRETKRDKMRNVALQRVYEGTFYIAWHIYEFIRRFMKPYFDTPIRPFHGGDLTSNAAALFLVEASCLLNTVIAGTCDALCAFCESAPAQTQPPEPPELHAGPQIASAPVRPTVPAPIGPSTPAPTGPSIT